ncbi:MAG: hypothetical protein P8Z37_14115 [Acidobacteriota bacterium]
MRKSITIATMCLSIFFLGAFTASAADPCDRKCLERHADKVLEAMIEHDPGRLMLAKDVVYTENGVELILGDGLWGTASARGKYSLYVSDVETGQVGFYGTLSELGNRDYIALRVKVYEALIEEIEVVVARPSGSIQGADGQPAPSAGEILNGKKPREQFLKAVPKEERMSREELIRVANTYFTGLANQTGDFTAPFAGSCERWENGIQSTNQPPNPNTSSGGIDILSMGCEEQQKSGWFAFVTEIRDRRYPVVDIERGLVFSFAFFDHNAAVRTYPLPDGTMTPNILTYPQTIEISELFKIRKGRIDQIEAVINAVPYRMSSEVWDK